MKGGKTKRTRSLVRHFMFFLDVMDDSDIARRHVAIFPGGPVQVWGQWRQVLQLRTSSSMPEW